MIKKLFNWIFKTQLEELQKEISDAREATASVISETKRCSEISKSLNSLIPGIDVSVDVQEYEPAKSWAVISLQGQKSDFIKFIDLSPSDIKDISVFISRYERKARIKVDASPRTGFL